MFRNESDAAATSKVRQSLRHACLVTCLLAVGMVAAGCPAEDDESGVNTESVKLDPIQKPNVDPAKAEAIMKDGTAAAEKIARHATHWLGAQDTTLTLKMQADGRIMADADHVLGITAEEWKAVHDLFAHRSNRDLQVPTPKSSTSDSFGSLDVIVWKLKRVSKDQIDVKFYGVAGAGAG